MKSNTTFLPDWASPPGATIRDILSERGMENREFGYDVGMNLGELSRLFSGEIAITLDFAQLLEEKLGSTAQFWLDREAKYRIALNRQADLGSHACKAWLDVLPVRDMLRFGWIEPDDQNFIELARECLRFFGTETVNGWNDRARTISRKVAFRTSPTLEGLEASTLAWLRQGEIEAESLICDRWDATGLRRNLDAFRSLTRVKEPEQFLPDLQRLCASHGVAFVVVRSPNGCRASGATRFLDDGRASIEMSFRYLSDDHFWFTFFHEVGHLVLHDQSALFLEGEDPEFGLEEQEANEFAAEALVPLQYREEMYSLPVDGREVMRFARKIGISPGIVVGQMQHSGKFTYRQLNNLKRRYQWG